MSTFDVDLLEPIHPGWTADTAAVTADSVIYTADGGPLVPATEATDAGVNAHIYDVDIFEPVAHGWTADTTAITADSVIYTADGGPLVGATELLDAEVIAVPIIAVGEIYRRRPRVIEGVGFGILSALEGEAHGVIYASGGAGHATLPSLTGSAEGAADDPLDLEILLLMLAA